MKNVCGLLLAVFVCAGCAAVDKTPIYYTSTFNKAQAERLLRPGKNKIIVNDFVVIKEENEPREIYTCAGGYVQLIPATERATEFVQILFGSNSWIYNSRTGGILARIANEDPDFGRLVVVSRCDSDGFATFDNVADGEFYVMSQLRSFLSVAKVSVKGGQTKKVVL